LDVKIGKAKCQIGAMILPSNDAEVTDGKGRD